MNTNRTFTITLAQHDRDMFAVRVHRQGDRWPMEFRGPGYETPGWPGSWAQRLHDALEGWHACLLHACQPGDSFAVLPGHPDYHKVAALFDAAFIQEDRQ